MDDVSLVLDLLAAFGFVGPSLLARRRTEAVQIVREAPSFWRFVLDARHSIRHTLGARRGPCPQTTTP